MLTDIQPFALPHGNALGAVLGSVFVRRCPVLVQGCQGHSPRLGLVLKLPEQSLRGQLNSKRPSAR